MQQRFFIDPEDDDAAAGPGFAAALAAIEAGQLVAIPTETVYGLAADATNAAAVASIFSAKERPRFNPLIAHIADLETAQRHGRLNPRAQRLAEAFWPGPLTLVVARQADSPIADLVTAGLDTVALRMPAMPLTRALAAALGAPLAAPSANRSGRISATTADDVVAELGARIAVVLDAGPCPVGIESTIVSVLGAEPVLLRPGGLSRQAIEAVLGERLADPAPGDGASPAAPGMLSSHYAPRARLRLNARTVEAGQALLAFGPELPPGAENAVRTCNLSPAGDIDEAARHLFGALRALDASGAAVIAAMPVPDDGLGEAINDRLARAAADRPDDG